MSSLTCLASPRMAAMWRGVSPRSFLLLTLSFCRDEALLGTFFCTGVVCEGWLGVESGNKQREKYLIDAWSKSLTGKPVLTCLCVYFQHLRTNLHCLTTNHHNLFTKIISVMFSGYIFNDNSTISLGKYTEQLSFQLCCHIKLAIGQTTLKYWRACVSKRLEAWLSQQ